MTATDVLWLVTSFLFGSVFGSFLNVCIYRMPKGESVLWPPSHCPKCFQPVGRWNIPIVGYFLVGGKCRLCGEKFSIQYPAVELLTAVIASFFYYRLVMELKAPVPLYLAYTALAMILVVASFVDLTWRIIPKTLTTVGIVLALGGSAAYPKMHALYIGYHGGGGKWGETLSRWVAAVPPVDGLFASIAGAVAGVVLIVVVRFVGTKVFRREAMGLGDAKLLAVIGGFLGWRAVPMVFLVAAFVGAAAGIVSYFRTRDHEIPLGPFLSIGTVVVMLWGNAIMNWWVLGVMGLTDAPTIVSAGWGICGPR